MEKLAFGGDNQGFLSPWKVGFSDGRGRSIGLPRGEGGGVYGHQKKGVWEIRALYIYIYIYFDCEINTP